MTKEYLINKLKLDYNFLHHEYNVEKIGIFGSYVSGNYTENSDVDIIVKFSKPIGFKFFELVEFLEKELGKNVDIITDIGLNGVRVENIKHSIEESIIYV